MNNIKRIIITIILLLLTTPVFALYDQPYIEHDNQGISQINCIRCNDPLKTRIETNHGYRFKKVSHISQIKFYLTDGSFTNLYMCKDCKREYQPTEKELKGLSKQFRKGFILEAEAAKESKEIIKSIENRYKNISIKKDNRKGVEQ